MPYFTLVELDGGPQTHKGSSDGCPLHSIPFLIAVSRDFRQKLIGVKPGPAA